MSRHFSSSMFSNDDLWNTRRRLQRYKTRSFTRSNDDVRVNNFQYSQLTSNMLRGVSLSPRGDSIATTRISPSLIRRTKPIRLEKIPQTSGLRTYNDIVNSGAYSPSYYHPQTIGKSSQQEKDRLAHIMAYGTDPTKIVYETIKYPTTSHDIDRFDELIIEIEQRKQFLDQMTSIGKRKQYEQIISNEIADKIHEMEIIDKQRSKILNDYSHQNNQLDK